MSSGFLLVLAAAAAGGVVVDINGLGKIQGNAWPDLGSEEFLGEAHARFPHQRPLPKLSSSGGEFFSLIHMFSCRACNPTTRHSLRPSTGRPAQIRPESEVDEAMGALHP